MAIRKILTSAIIIFFLASVGMALWLYEIAEIKTWCSLNWVREELYSPFFISLIPVLAFMTPFFVNRQLAALSSIISIIILYAANMICFLIGAQLCYEQYDKLFLLVLSSDEHYFIFATLKGFSLYLFLGFTYWLTTHTFLKKNKKINAFFITLLLVLTIPLSLLTIQINTGFGSGTDWVDAVKMGYPIFWTTMLLGLTGIIIARQPNISQTQATKKKT